MAEGIASIGKEERVSLIRQALRLEWVTVAWMVLEAAIALAAGIAAASLSLIAFGVDSIIELMSAAVLLWRLNVELKQGAAFSEEAEARASRIGGALLFALAAYVMVSAAWGLWNRHGQEFSGAGFAITVLAIPVMYGLAKGKLSLADKIDSRALRADAVESITCGYLSFVVVAGLTAQWLLGLWWIDSVTSLAIVVLLIREPTNAISMS
jgi:divalent metal cation (Fe/Co/Zn/Cd) transporter